MLDMRLGLLAVCAGALAVYGLRGTWSQPEVAFTRPAPAAPAGLDLRAASSTLHVAVPVDFSSIARRAEAALEQRLSLGLSPDLTDPSCAKRQPVGECAPVRLDGTLSQAGPAEIVLRGHAIRVTLPLRIDPTLRPEAQQSAAVEPAAADRQPRSIRVSFAYAVRSAPGGGFTVARLDDMPVDAANAGANVRIVRQLEGRLRQVALAAQDELNQVMARLPVATAAQRAWAAMAQPVQLGAGSGVALLVSPEIAGAAELVSLGDKPAVVVPIQARLTIGPAESGASAPHRPFTNGVVAMSGRSQIRMAMPIGLEGLQQAATADLVKAGAMETRPDRFGPPVKVLVHGVRVYPSTRQIALELDVTATRYEGQAFRGKAHLTGRPVLDAAQATVTLADITFPPAAPGTVHNLPANAPRVATEPFAGRLTSVARIDVSRETEDAIPRAMNLLHQRLDDRLALSARIDKAHPVGVETSRDGAWLVTDLLGDLTFTYTGPLEIAAGRASEPAPKASAGGRASTPEAAAAAVVPAAAAAAAAMATRAPATATAPVTSITAAPPVTREAPAATAKSAAVRSTPATPVVIKPVVARPATAKQSSGAKKTASPAVRRDWVPFASNN